MSRPCREDAFNLGQLVQLYFEAHPERKAANDARNSTHGTAALWLGPSDIPDLVDWARGLKHITVAQGQFLITAARYMVNNVRNAQE